MTRRRWIADEVSGNRAALIGSHARHLAQVLRAQIGQEFEISTGAEVRSGKVLSVHPERVEFELGQFVTECNQAEVTIALSIFKFDRMEWAIEKCTELGVGRIVPVIAARTESHLAKASMKRVERWRRIARQATEQSRQAFAPEVSDPIKLRELIGIHGDRRIVVSEMEKKVMLNNAIPPQFVPAILALGPEGGWKEEELSAFRESGWIAASLGKTILRTETAAIAAVAIAMALR